MSYMGLGAGDINDEELPMTKMVDVAIDSDEAYPVYYMRTPDKWCPVTGQVDAETYERWTRISKEYDRVQTEMASFQCVHADGGHTFITLGPEQGSRTYCTNCHTDKGETQWDNEN